MFALNVTLLLNRFADFKYIAWWPAVPRSVNTTHNPNIPLHFWCWFPMLTSLKDGVVHRSSLAKGALDIASVFKSNVSRWKAQIYQVTVNTTHGIPFPGLCTVKAVVCERTTKQIHGGFYWIHTVVMCQTESTWRGWSGLDFFHVHFWLLQTWFCLRCWLLRFSKILLQDAVLRT